MKQKKYESVYNLFWIFIVGCLFGWMFELIVTYISKGIFINHSAVVIGPFNMAYGIPAVLLTTILYKYRNDSNIKLFLIGFVVGSIIEYIMSFGMELVLGFSAWDYTDRFLNINGRVCLLFSTFWGIIAILWIKVIYPFFIKLINKINYDIGRKLMIFLAVFLVFDSFLTISAILRARAKEKGIAASNKYEEILDKTFNKDYLTNMYNGHWSD